MQCPKCKHIQDSEETCESCGIIFANYYKSLIRQKQLQMEALNSNRVFPIKTVGILAAVVAVITIFIQLRGGQDSETQVGNNSENRVLSRWERERREYDIFVNGSKQEQLIKSAASRAVFTIPGRYGSSVGLILTKGCLGVVNKSALKENRKSYQRQVERYNRQADRDARRRSREYNSRSQSFVSDCENCPSSRYRSNSETLYQRNGNNYGSGSYRRSYGTASRLERPKNKVDIYYRRDRLEGRFLEESSTFDLALVTTNESECSYADIGDSKALKPGDDIFTIDRYMRVATSKFKGFKKNLDGDRFFIHDNKSSGYPGTPIFNKDGEVVAINFPQSGKPRKAIPIETVLRVFKIVY